MCLAHIITPSDPCIYQNLGLHIGTHAGEDHTGDAIGMVRLTPWEAVVAAADIAVKAGDVQISFMDRFCGSLIITGGLSQVQTAVTGGCPFLGEERILRLVRSIKADQKGIIDYYEETVFNRPQ